MKRFAITLTFALLLCTSMWGQAAYSFQTVNYPNDNFTQLLGVNNSLLIAGYHNANENSGLTLRLPVLFTTENYPQSMSGGSWPIADAMACERGQPQRAVSI